MRLSLSGWVYMFLRTCQFTGFSALWVSMKRCLSGRRKSRGKTLDSGLRGLGSSPGIGHCDLTEWEGLGRAVALDELAAYPGMKIAIFQIASSYIIFSVWVVLTSTWFKFSLMFLQGSWFLFLPRSYPGRVNFSLCRCQI